MITDLPALSGTLVTDSLDSSEGETTLASFGEAKYCFTDVETTGFAAMRHCVITLQIYVTDAEYRILDELYLEFRPDGSKKVCWTEDAEKIHGIPWEKAITFPPLEESFFKLKSFLEKFPKGLIMVAHNMPFDRRMIKDLFNKTYQISSVFDRFFPIQECTLQLARRAGLITGKVTKLDIICEALGIEHTHHDATSDAKVLIPIHKACMEKLGKAEDNGVLESSESDETTEESIFLDMDEYTA